MYCVLKFGGSSVATIARIEHVTNIIKQYLQNKIKVIVVVSAMQGATTHLLEMTNNFCSTLDDEVDVVLSTGEQISVGLLSLCLKQNGIKAVSMLGWQVPIIVENNNIIDINKDCILSMLKHDQVPIIAGFQGITKHNRIMTIGRGGSDATAIAIAAAILSECVIYTDVDGVYTADPRVVTNAKRLTSISYDDMYAMSLTGAKVLQDKSVEIAKKSKVNIRVLSSFTSDNIGTLVTDKTNYYRNIKIAGFAHSKDFYIDNKNRLCKNYQTQNSRRVGVITATGPDANKIQRPEDCLAFWTTESQATIVVKYHETEFMLNKLHDAYFL